MSESLAASERQFDQHWPSQPLGHPMPGTSLAGENVIYTSGNSRTFGGYGDNGEDNPGDTLGYTCTLDGINQYAEFARSLDDLKADFAPYQHVLLGGNLYLVVKLIELTAGVSSAMILDPAPTQIPPQTGVSVKRVPNLSAITVLGPQRVSQYAGNAVRFQDEAIFSVGRGPLRVNGDATAVPLTAAARPKVAYPDGSGSYEVHSVGFAKPAKPTLASAGGGTKGMKAGEISIKITHCREGFRSRGPASDAEYVTISDGDKIQVTAAAFPADGTNAFEVWATKRNDARRGPWWLQGKYVSVGPHDVEFLDEELTDKLVDDNDAPPPCLQIVDFGDLLLYVSFGSSLTDPAVPLSEGGPGIAPAKVFNPEAASPTAYTFISPAEDIVGAQVGKRFVFFLSANHLHVGQRSANDLNPLLVYSYGHTGYKHRWSGVVANDVFYGLTGDGLIRTIDGENMDNTFCPPVKDDLAHVNNALAFVGHDPKGKMVVVFENYARQGSGGKWQVKAHSLNIEYNPPRWNTPAILGDGSTADFLVTGVATVGEVLWFVTSDGTVYEWDNGTQTIVGYLCSNFDASGAARYRDTARFVKVSGGINGSLRLFRNLQLAEMQANNPTAGSVVKQLPNPSYKQKHQRICKFNWQGESFAVRFDFSMPGNKPLIDTYEIGTVTRDGLMQ